MAGCFQSNFTLAGIIRKKVIIVIARATPKKKKLMMLLFRMNDKIPESC